MKVVLCDFQDTAVRKLARYVRRAAEEIDDDLQAVVLSSPTGSGKTVMATALIEWLINGDPDGDAGPDPNATFLWVTDQPDLNVQTWRKMLDHSTILDRSRLIQVETTFSQEMLDAGKVYFINTQKLGKGKNLTKRADERPWTFWETITNTIKDRPKSFVTIIDEAHRGTTLSAKDRAEANSIVQRFIVGFEEMPATPLIVGISATTARFHALLEHASRQERKHEVTPDEVRLSGLLKERIVLHHPEESQPSDIALLRTAAREWNNYHDRWTAYSTAQNLPQPVEPVLVVQVEDAKASKLSATDLGEAIRAIDDEIGPLGSGAYAHSFQEHRDIEVDGIPIRYIAPPDIEVEEDVKVVFFKTSLNTGWDCPRAEVMMSYRAAVDHTLIAQLVGRMVRTPLAMRVDTDDKLNSVRLYLPRYNAQGLDEVIKYLNGGDEAPPVETIDAKDIATYSKAPDSAARISALQGVPSYIVPRRRVTSQVRRLMKFARQLANDEVRATAVDEAYGLLLDLLRTRHRTLKDDAGFQQRLAATGSIDLRVVELVWGRGVEGEAESIQVEIAEENIDDLFRAAARKFGEGLEWHWLRRLTDEGIEPSLAKREAFALASYPDVIEALQAAAKQQTVDWLREYRQQIDGATGTSRQTYEIVKQLADRAEETNLFFPDSIEVRKGPEQIEKHLYVDDDGKYAPFPKLNTWEQAVLKAELARPGVVGWLRNIPNKEWALCVPYANEEKSLYPDFLILRKKGSKIEVDIIDPHLSDFSDAAPKANGLALFAARHADRFGRILILTKVENKMRSIDLIDEQMRQRVSAAHDQAALQLVLKEFGTIVSI